VKTVGDVVATKRIESLEAGIKATLRYIDRANAHDSKLTVTKQIRSELVKTLGFDPD
jgi:hypothetical protein